MAQTQSHLAKWCLAAWPMSAAVAIALLPMFVLYVIGLRVFIEGIVMTGLKG
jgi:ABC-type glycerol-3-phosphate transport system permease component